MDHKNNELGNFRIQTIPIRSNKITLNRAKYRKYHTNWNTETVPCLFLDLLVAI